MVKITENKILYFGKVKDLLLQLSNLSMENCTVQELLNLHLK